MKNPYEAMEHLVAVAQEIRDNHPTLPDPCSYAARQALDSMSPEALSLLATLYGVEDRPQEVALRFVLHTLTAHLDHDLPEQTFVRFTVRPDVILTHVPL
jgi:hypothetical protein